MNERLIAMGLFTDHLVSISPGLLADPGLIAEPGRFADPGRFGEPGLLEEYTGEDGVFPRAPWELKGARDIIGVVLPPELNILSRWALFFALDMRPNVPSGRGTSSCKVLASSVVEEDGTAIISDPCKRSFASRSDCCRRSFSLRS